MIFCSTENVINSFHLGVISTIHLWRFTCGCTTLEKVCFQGTGCGLWPWLLQSFRDFGRSCLQCSFRSPPRSCSVELHGQQSLCHLWNNLKLSLNGRRTVCFGCLPCDIEKKPIWGQQSCENWTALQVPFLAGFRTQKKMSPQYATMLAKEFFLKIKPLVGYFRVCPLFPMNPWYLIPSQGSRWFGDARFQYGILS